MRVFTAIPDEGVQSILGSPACPAGGTTYGSVFIVNADSKRSLKGALAGNELMAHEYVHAEQWAMFGWGFAPAYGAAEGLNLSAAGSGGWNVFERLADERNDVYRGCNYG